jgi:hypothetical protein
MLYTHTNPHIYSEREDNCFSLSEGTTGGRRWKENVREWKNIPVTHLYMNIIYCTVSWWILGDGDREWVSNVGGGVNLIKA